MATLQSAIDFARAQAQTDSNGLTDANGIIFSNEALTDFRRKLISNSVDAGGTQEAYRDGSAGVGTYLYPTSPQMMFLKAIEVNYAGGDAANYVTATQLDVANTAEATSFSWLRANASPLTPQFDDRGDYFEIFPTPTSANNLSQLFRIIYFPQPTEFAATSDTVSYPESLDYRILGWRIAADYYYSLNKMVEGDAFNVKYEERVKDMVGMLARGTQQPLQASVIPLTGWEF